MYNLILTSYNSVTTEKLFAPIRQRVPEMIEIFNQMFYPLELITKSKTLNLDDNKEHLEIGIVKNGVDEKYSQIYALGADSKYGRDSLTANVLIADEHTKIQMFGEGNFAQSFMPMLNSTSGVLLSYGITSADATCVGYNLYINDKVKKFIAGWEKVYHNKLMNSDEEGEGYKQASLSFRDIVGENSTEWLTNYIMTFDVLDGKFMSPKLIKDNNLMRTVWEMPNYTNEKKYIVGGLDLSSITDRTVLTIMESELQNDKEDRWINETKEIIIYNINKTSLDADKIITDTVNHCISRKLDILLVDATGMQRVIVNSIINEAKKQNCKTQIIPYDFSGNKKWTMFQYFEKSLYSQRCLLPKREYLDTYKEVQIMYDEMICLVKEKPSETSNFAKYYAPSGKTDDVMCSMAMANYATAYVRLCELERKEITLGKYQFIPRLKKANWNNEKQNFTPISMYDTW